MLNSGFRWGKQYPLFFSPLLAHLQRVTVVIFTCAILCHHCEQQPLGVEHVSCQIGKLHTRSLTFVKNLAQTWLKDTVSLPGLYSHLPANLGPRHLGFGFSIPQKRYGELGRGPSAHWGRPVRWIWALPWWPAMRLGAFGALEDDHSGFQPFSDSSPWISGVFWWQHGVLLCSWWGCHWLCVCRAFQCIPMLVMLKVPCDTLCLCHRQLPSPVICPSDYIILIHIISLLWGFDWSVCFCVSIRCYPMLIGVVRGSELWVSIFPMNNGEPVGASNWLSPQPDSYDSFGKLNTVEHVYL